MIPFAEWAPDLAPLTGSTQGATNIIPAADGYRSAKETVAVSAALGARCQGALSAFDGESVSYNFAGTDTKLYQLSATAVTDRSQAGDYDLADDYNWEFAKWGSDQVIAVAWPDDPTSPGNTIPQIATMGAAFADMITDETSLCAAHVGVIREFVMLGHIYDGSNYYPSRVWWSRIGDETQFTVSAQYQADYQDLEGNPGKVQSIQGGEYGVIVCERSVFRAEYVGTPGVFQLDETLPGIGTRYPWSVCQYGDTVYLWADDGIKAIDRGASVRHIGKNKVDRTVYDDISEGYANRVVGAVDPTTLTVWWIYPGGGSSGGIPNKCLVYDVVNDRFGLVEQTAEWVYSILAAGYTLDGLDAVGTMDTLPESLDSLLWAGGGRSFGIFNTDHKAATFTGAAKEAIIETGEVEPNEGYRTLMQRVSPRVDGGTPTVSVGYRARQQDSVAWTPYVPIAESGFALIRKKSGFFRARVKMTSGFTRGIGVSFRASKLGNR